MQSEEGRPFDPIAELAKYDVVWDSPSEGHDGSMPLGNGEVGLNAWIEPSGDLVLYLARTDSWDENGRLLKVGKVRVRLSPRPMKPGARFRQRLSLCDATMQVDIGSGEDSARLRLWVDANHPIACVEIESKGHAEALVEIEAWRKKRERLPRSEVGDPAYGHEAPGNNHYPVFVEPDTLLEPGSGRIGWYHRNEYSLSVRKTMELQELADFPMADPLLFRTFGCVVRSASGKAESPTRLKSPRSRSHRFDLCVLTKHPAKRSEWLEAVDAAFADADRAGHARRRRAHEAWWRSFWNRSWIFVSASEKPGKAVRAEAQDEARTVTRGYILQRFVTACAGRGEYPIKFNGSIFNVPHEGAPGDADYRRWGAGFWWQNTRLPYFATCAAGDFDVLKALFRMYAGEHLRLAKFRTKKHLGHEGAFLNECAYFWGAAFNESYGWKRPTAPRTGVNESGWHRWEFQGGLELAWMMLDYYEHTLDKKFLRETLVPFAREILLFYDLHYHADERGKMVIHPSQALETWWDCTNPMPEVAGLQGVCERLLMLPAGATPKAGRALWERVLAKTPELPVREIEGKRLLAPAERFAQKRNVENAELYAVFPYRRLAVGRPNLEWGIEALRRREDRGNFGWRQEDVFMAYLGLAEEAREYVSGRAAKKHDSSRFPAFWGPNYDWTPDQCHGGVLMKALQAMLLQTDGKAIYLLPAWPKEWDVRFKLHAPYRTVVEGRVRGGQVPELSVVPASRVADVSHPKRNAGF